MKNNIKVLVTGATGFIGQYVIRYLLKIPGVEVIGTTRNINKAKGLDFYNEIQFVEIDFSNINENIFQKLNEPDILINLAWDGLPNYKELFHIEKNFFENYKFIKTMIGSGLKNINVTGTCLEYGFVEGSLKETLITNPSNSYAIAKDSLRKCIDVLSTKYSFSFKWLRLFYMYGIGQSANSIISQIEQSVARGDKLFNMSGGEQLRDYLHVSRVAEYIVKCSLQDKVTGIINCCSGSPISLRKFVENYIKENHYDIELNLGYYPYLDYEPLAFWGENSKLKSIIQ